MNISTCLGFKHSQNKYEKMEPGKISKEPSSPCKRVCRLDEDGMCVGCFRNLDEIASWSIMGKEEKLDVLRKAHLRLQLRDLKL